jgi:hypothetical protein
MHMTAEDKSNQSSIIEIAPMASRYIESQLQYTREQDPDPDSGELQAELLQAELEAKARFYLWLQQTARPHTVLYPGSGAEQLPQIVFGNVIHVSLEEYNEQDPYQYFDALPEGQKVIADNAHLPFANDRFDLVFVDSPFEDNDQHRSEFTRILSIGGSVVLSQTYETDEDVAQADPDTFSNLFPELEKVIVPEEVQGRHPLRYVDFFMLRKAVPVISESDSQDTD